ncbi:alpha/beta hydrolase [Plantactinospora sp. GCM10030261]|uniref:alpha/beta hydrolase n=1 Tax=Plantactinospora sp. GCM10030261 TaxID=3273420 RepID=UPI003623C4E0
MMTYEQLWATDPASWRAAGAAWCAVPGLVDRRAAELTGTADRLPGVWSGPAGGAAVDRLRRLRGELVGGRPVGLVVDQLLAEHADRLRRAKASLAATVGVAERAGLLVDRDGVVSRGPTSGPDADRLQATAVAGIRAALGMATEAERATAHRLTELTAAAAAGWPAEPTAGIPAPDTAPAAVRRWWDGLPAAARRWLLANEPALIGRLDGLPVTVRDLANRLLLTGLRADLLARRADLLTGVRPPWALAELRRVSGAIAGLDVLAARLSADTGPRAYLLALATTGDGRAVLAVGDPDHADKVLTYVPGMTSDLPGVAGELGRVDRMAARCAELDPTARTAAVLWLDYDAPDFLDEAARRDTATEAGPALHRFQDGLRVSHDGPPARLTVLGHSYGSLVVGLTARDHGVTADGLIFVGSPGVGVDRVSDLGLPADRVWASTAGNDVIQHFARPPVDLLAGVAAPAHRLATPYGLPADDLWFGRNPADAGFGGGTFRSGPHGHVGYWDDGNPALDAMARIALTGPP